MQKVFFGGNAANAQLYLSQRKSRTDSYLRYSQNSRQLSSEYKKPPPRRSGRVALNAFLYSLGFIKQRAHSAEGSRMYAPATADEIRKSK